mgnify:FL=1
MRIFDPTSPYWLDDPQVAIVERDGMADIVGYPSAVLACPNSPTPVIRTDVMNGTVPRTAGLFATPLPYLPYEVGAWYANETPDAHQLRILNAMDMMGLLEHAQDGTPVYAPLPTQVDDPQKLVDAFDGIADDDTYKAIRAEYGNRMREAWPDGYPVGELLGLWNDMALLSRLGSLALAVHRVLALCHEGEEGVKAGVGLLETIQTSYGDDFKPDDMTPQGVDAWYEAHVEDVDRMADLLARLGLESEQTATLLKEVAHEPRA